ncbi:MAG: uroporphyrinogen decarboxylase [Rhodospirillales bacterium]|nr:MAG: uroporphyrinogen decarboxylase [Rhodospirillales bacterium]
MNNPADSGPMPTHTPDAGVLRQAFRQTRLRRPPFWLMRQAGRYLPEYRALREGAPNFLQFCYTPGLTTEAALQPLRRFGMDAAIVFSDILVVPHALGADVRFIEGVGPRLQPIRSTGDVAALVTDRLEERLEPVYAGVEGLRRALGPEMSLIGFAGAPWTLACYMVEGQGGTEAASARRWGYADPEGFGALVAILTDAVVRHLGCQIARGADVVQLFDSWAGLLSEQQFRRWVIAPTAAIVARLKAEWPAVPIIGFPRGAGVLHQAYVEETGVDGVGLDAAVPADWAADHLQAKVLVQGNLDNQLLVAGGVAMDREIDRLLSVLGQGRYVFNLGHGVLPETPPEHVARLAERVRAWPGAEGSR